MRICCCRQDGRYAAGDLLRCTWQIEDLGVFVPQGLELSVLWYTEGKGDEDLNVHYFHRWSSSRLSELALDTAQHFETRLPESPLSYSGHLFRIRWCIRMRLYISHPSNAGPFSNAFAGSSGVGGGKQVGSRGGAGIVVEAPFAVVSRLNADPPTAVPASDQRLLSVQ